MALAPSLSVFRHRPYLHYWIARVLIAGARQMATVAIAWQVYDTARLPVAEGGLGYDEPAAAFLIGMVGLAQFVPVFFLSLIGGQAADRLDRKAILIVCQTIRLAGLAALFASDFMP
ncbi:MAG: MFS transporter, partial [Pseudomonadota bacterium]